LPAERGQVRRDGVLRWRAAVGEGMAEVSREFLKAKFSADKRLYFDNCTIESTKTISGAEILFDSGEFFLPSQSDTKRRIAPFCIVSTVTS
jgi:hypothetical protein